MAKISYIKCEQLDESSEVETEGKSYVAVKRCRMLRSGIQLYLHDEVPAELLKLLPAEKQNLPVYKVYRKPEAVVKHLKDFNYIAFVNTHPSVDVTPSNYKELSIGHVGGTAKLVTLDDGNVYVENEVVFTDKEAFKEYKEGKKEVSIGLMAMWRLADSSEYDFEVYDFENVNHLALVPKARAGKMAKIMDSSTVVDRICGGTHMKKGFLELLGLKKPVKDSEKLLSDTLFAGIAQIKKEMKDEEVKAIVLSVMDSVAPLGETEQKKVLTGIITDALSDPDSVNNADADAKKKLADSVDKLYAKCKALDEEAARKVIEDACGSENAEKPAEDEKPKDKKDEKDPEQNTNDGCGANKDAAPDLEGLVVSTVSKALDSAKIEEKVDAAVRRALNLDSEHKPEAKGANTDASAINFEDASLLPNGWGR